MSRAEKYYNSNEKFTREIQRQICTEERISKLKDRTMRITESEKQKEMGLKKATIKWINHVLCEDPSLLITFSI